MDRSTLVAGLDFVRARLIGSIETIEKSGQDVEKVLAWRPGPGRAHIAWQLLHCAATHDRYVNVTLLGGKANDEALVANFAGGSTPSDQNIPSLADIRQKLESSYANFKSYVNGLQSADLERIAGTPGRERKIGDTLTLLIWHEAHHQGQIHLTWNLYKAAHGIKP